METKMNRFDDIKVLIDPGHGGKDLGAKNTTMHEKDIVLPIALELEKTLNYYSINTKMTRDVDKYVSITERVWIESNYRPDYFVSIHINAGGGEGAELIHSMYGTRGKKLCLSIASELASRGNLRVRRVFSRPSTRDPYSDYYGVIRRTKSPAAIVEYGFIDNPEDVLTFDTLEKQRELGRITAYGILKYLKYPLNELEPTE